MDLRQLVYDGFSEVGDDVGGLRKFLQPAPTATGSYALNYDGTDYSWATLLVSPPQYVTALPGAPLPSTTYYHEKANGTVDHWVTDAAGDYKPIHLHSVYKADADLTINSTALVDFPGVSLPMLAGQTWAFDIVVHALVLNAAADLRFNVVGDAAGWYGVTHAENAVSKSEDIGTATTNIAVATGNNANADTITVHGIATANTDTTLQLQLRNNAGTTAQSFSGFSHIKGTFVS